MSTSEDNLVIGYIKLYLREGRPEVSLIRITHVESGGIERSYVGERRCLCLVPYVVLEWPCPQIIYNLGPFLMLT